MLLDLKRVFVTEGVCVSFDYKLDLSGYEAAGGEFPFREPVSVRGSVRNTAGVVELSGKAVYDYHTRCDRCCAPVVEHAGLPVHNILVTKLENQETENDDLLLVEDEKLDLDDLVTSDIVLSLPMKHLCREGCKGICPTCGKNLNDGPCGCREEPDERLAALKNLL